MKWVAVLFLILGSVSFADEEVQFTKNGQVFKKDANFPSLGNAWRDSTGLVWGDLVTFGNDHSAASMTYLQAKSHCEHIGARLPTQEDFLRLREAFGAVADNLESYEPQVLPNFTFPIEDGKPYGVADGTIFGRTFWTSTPVHSQKFDKKVLTFKGKTGTFEEASITSSSDFKYVVPGREQHVAHLYDISGLYTRCVIDGPKPAPGDDLRDAD